MKKLFCLVFFCSMTQINCAQHPIIHGVVIDKSTKAPIAYAHVSSTDKRSVTYTNTEGKFSIQVDKSPEAVLMVSHILYQNKSVVLSDSTFYVVEISPGYRTLTDLTIRDIDDVKNIVEKAALMLDKNMYSMLYVQRGHYQLKVQRNGKYEGFSESVIDLVNGGYTSAYSKRKYKYLPSDGIVLKHTRSSSFNHLYDANGKLITVKNFSRLLNFKKHVLHNGFIVNTNQAEYELKDIVFEGGKTVYVVSFSPQKPLNAKKALQSYIHDSFIYDKLYEGVVYIDADDFAVLKIELQLGDRGFDKLTTVRNELTLCSHKPISDVLSIIFKKNEQYHAYILSFVERVKKYEDYGWGVGDGASMELKQTLLLEDSLIIPVSVKALAGVFPAEDSVLIEHFDDLILISQNKTKYCYDAGFWLNNMHYEDYETRKIYADLESGGVSIQSQFSMCAPFDSVAQNKIIDKYSPKYKLFRSNKNKFD